MTQEETTLLLQDLCARLLYTPQVVYNGITETLSTLHIFDMTHLKEEYVDIKPYLRPISSMTEEERKELSVVCGIDYIDDKVVDFGEFLCEGSPVNIKNIHSLLDWLNAHHFDYRGLIPMGLALPAPEGMYND